MRSKPEQTDQNLTTPDRPSGVYILVRQTGSYSDFRENPIAAYLSEDAANLARDQAETEWRAAIEQWTDHDTPDAPCPDDDPRWLEWETKQRAENALLNAMLVIDPGARLTSEWDSPGEPEYVVWSVPLAATARLNTPAQGLGL